MPRRRGLTDQQVATLPRKAKRYNYADPEMRGHYLRVSPGRATPISHAAVARDPSGMQRWATPGTADAMGIDQVRELAREAIKRIKGGKPTSEPGKPTVRDVAEQWLQRHVDKKGLRSAKDVRRIIDNQITPRIGARIFTELKRSDIANLLDEIEDGHGKRSADLVLAALRAMGRWVQSRDDDYVAPFVAGMRRTPAGSRERVLTDDEIRAVWKAAEQAGSAIQAVYGAAIRLLLLTAQRRDKVAKMRWDDVADGVWIIRTEAREKANAGKLRLPQAALDIMAAQPRSAGNPYVFAGNNGRPLTIFRAGEYKAQFDAKCGVTGWRLHDLRRTARSLMSRAGVQSEYAERVLGHVIPGIEGVYNRHQYTDEKAAALTKLAALIKQIVRNGDEAVG
jgi:integrase